MFSLSISSQISSKTAAFLARSPEQAHARKILLNALVNTIDGSGAWAVLDGLYILGAASNLAADQNLISSLYTLTEPGNPVFAADLGFTGASGKSLSTGFNPATAGGNFTQNAASAFWWSNTHPTNNGAVIGQASGTNLSNYPNLGGDAYFRLNSASDLLVPGISSGQGFMCVTRPDASNLNVYQNNAFLGAFAKASAALVSSNIIALTDSTGAAWTGQLAAFGFGGLLTRVQVLSIYNALYTYLNAIAATGTMGLQAQRGVWTWFNNPRAIAVGSASAVGSVDTSGNSIVGNGDGFTAPFILRNIEYDDHNDPAFLIRASDSKVLAFYAGHQDADLWMRISTNASDVTAWGAEVTLTSQLNSGAITYTFFEYADVVQLTGEANQPIYLFFKGFGDGGQLDLCYSKSTNGGATFPGGIQVVENPGFRPYFHLVNNGTTRIDFVLSDGHPNQGPNSLYHMYYQAGNFYKSNGTQIVAALPFLPTACTRIWDGTTVAGSGWNWDIVIDLQTGYPAVVYAVFPDSATDHRYRYAKWTGSAWVDNQVCTAGAPLYAAETFYSGGITIDPNDINTIWCSRQTSGIHQIFKGVTVDGGANWTMTQITSGPQKAFRPYMVRNARKLAFVRGTYTTFSNFAANIELLDV